MGSAARRAEAYKQIKYVWRVQQAGGGAIFEGACVEDYGGSGRGLGRWAQIAAEHPVENDELLFWASEAVAGPTGPAARRLAPPRLGSPPASPLCRRRYAPVPGGVPSADSRLIHMSLGVFNDGQHMGSSLPGLGGLQQAGPLMATA
jgi:hypothetical protein